MTQIISLITGGNRGIGLGLVKRFLEQPNQTVVAAIRDPSHPTAKALSDLPKGQGSSLIVVKYDAAVEKDASAVVEELQTKHGVEHLDIVVANAGIHSENRLVREVQRAEILELLDVNVFGVLSLYQAARGLLQKAAKPVFAPLGSTAGSLSRQPGFPNAAYGASKSMLPWYGVRLHAEEPWLATYILDPGFTQTDMGNSAAQKLGMKEAPIPIDDCCDGLFKVITTGTREKLGGRAVRFTGEVLEW